MHPELPDEIRRAKWPHELFLINLVFNHILLFASTFGVYSTFPLMVMIVPAISLVITAYLLIKARKVAASDETKLVKAHWIIADRRNKHFLTLMVLISSAGGGGYWLATTLGWSKVQTIALLAGAGLLPMMVSLLILIVLGNASMYEARHNKFPKGLEPDQSPTARV